MNQTVPILNPWMLAAAVASALAGLLHVGCVVFGASWYRFVGAGQPMVQMVEPSLGPLGHSRDCIRVSAARHRRFLYRTESRPKPDFLVVELCHLRCDWRYPCDWPQASLAPSVDSDIAHVI